jgi:hypothetical protein
MEKIATIIYDVFTINLAHPSMDFKQLMTRMIELQIAISQWHATNSQSDPAAYAQLRAYKKELQEIKRQLGI